MLKIYFLHLIIIDGDSAVVVYGNYVEELFRLKKEGVLTARELFGRRPPDNQEEPREVMLVWTDTITKKDKSFSVFARQFFEKLKSGDGNLWNPFLLDSVVTCRFTIDHKSFLEGKYTRINDTAFLHQVLPSGKLSIYTIKTDTGYLNTVENHKILGQKNQSRY